MPGTPRVFNAFLYGFHLSVCPEKYRPHLVSSWPQHKAPSSHLCHFRTWDQHCRSLTQTWAAVGSFLLPLFHKTERGRRNRRACGEVDSETLISRVCPWAIPSGPGNIFFPHTVLKNNNSTLIYHKGPKFMVMTWVRFSKKQTVQKTDAQTVTHGRKHIHVLRSSPATQSLWNWMEKNCLSILSPTFDNIYSAGIKPKQKVLK